MGDTVNDLSTVIIESERLILRTWTPEDRPILERISDESRITRWLAIGEPLATKKVDQFLANQTNGQEQRGWCRWAVELRKPGLGDPRGVVGFCGFGCKFAPEVELGWTLLPQVWNRGLATEASRAALDYGFGTIGFGRIISAVLPDNAASRRIADKLGMHVEGNIKRDSQSHLRYVIDNPLPDAKRDPRFALECQPYE
jgi:RimJ/RimL family protein N-acetyltransferase